jgi:hypothetical protein
VQSGHGRLQIVEITKIQEFTRYAWWVVKEDVLFAEARIMGLNNLVTNVEFKSVHTSQRASDALNRARSRQSIRNDAFVILQFEARGIKDVRPRENCLTFWAWKALGRSVKKGEHGVQVETWFPVAVKDTEDEKRVIMQKKIATVFHKSQTEELQC